MSRTAAEAPKEYLKINPIVELLIAYCIMNSIPYNRERIEQRVAEESR